MPFYMITGGNMRDGFFHDVEFYRNEEELKKSIKEIDKSFKPKFSPIDTYFKFICCHCDFDTDAKLIIKATNLKYADILINEFPNQLPMNEEEFNIFIEKIEEFQSQMYEDAMEAWHDSEINGSNFNEKNSDWHQAYDDETSKWDRETGGSWRAENDFG
jgi:hypothetical protein